MLGLEGRPLGETQRLVRVGGPGAVGDLLNGADQGGGGGVGIQVKLVVD